MVEQKREKLSPRWSAMEQCKSKQIVACIVGPTSEKTKIKFVKHKDDDK